MRKTDDLIIFLVNYKDGSFQTDIQKIEAVFVQYYDEQHGTDRSVLLRIEKDACRKQDKILLDQLVDIDYNAQRDKYVESLKKRRDAVDLRNYKACVR
ncbi:hypothetical protein [Lactovum odontotermitis]